MYNNLFKEILIFGILVTYLVCYKAGLASQCSYDNCQNWFQDVTTVEQCNALFYPLSNKQGEFVSQITPNVDSLLNQACPDSTDSNILINFQNKLYSDRLYLYANALYFVIQTITTVGQGDVSAYSTQERMYNIACMLIGVMLFNIASAAFLEFTVQNNDNIFKDRSREDMIEKMQVKQLMKGKAKKFIKLLADSAQSDNLVEEVEFARRLPKYMCETVLNHMLEIYNNRLNLFKNEKLEIFTGILDCSSFKRCIPDECILTENGKINVVYSGQLGVKVTNVENQIHYDYIYKSKIGDEFGLLNQLDYKNQQFTMEHLVLCNSEIIEIDSAKYMDIMSRSNKGLFQIQNNLFDKVFNLQIILSLQYGMIMRGMQIDSAWQNKTLSLLNINQEDYSIFEELVCNFVDFKRDLYIEYGLNDWYFSFVDQKSRKHFVDKAMQCIDNNLKSEFKKLRECKFEFNKKMKISQLNEEDSKPMIGKFSEIKIFGI